MKVKTYPITGLGRLLGLEEVEAPRIFRHSAREGGKVGFCGGGGGKGEWIPELLNEDRRIRSKTYPNDVIGNRTHNFQVCSVMLHQTASPCTAA